MAYARLSNHSRWYIVWSDSSATRAEDERIELLHASAAASIELSFSAAKHAVATGELPTSVDVFITDDAQLVLTALREFVHDVSAHYAAPNSTAVVADDAPQLVAEARKISDMLRGRLVMVVRRPTSHQVVFEFEDGTRALVDAKNSDIEISVE